MIQKLLWLTVVALATNVLAGREELRSLIQNRLQASDSIKQFFMNALDAGSQAEAADCSQGQNLYCPLAKIPNATFGTHGGNVSSTASPCCPRNYLQCQIQQNTQYCRTLAYYTIPSSTGLSQESCPVTTPECTCQQSLSGESFLRLNFCPNVTPCCPNCMCYGDPHCRAFNGSTNIWAICDSRDTTCLNNPTTCATKTYQGQQCQWVPAQGAVLAYCSRPPGTTAPVMIMYSKSYQKYFTPTDPNTYQFALTLTLGTYGSIIRVDMVDTGASSQPYTWLIDNNGNCQGNSAFPFTGPNNIANVQGLPSMVTITMVCSPQKGKSPTSGRIDVLSLQDPWYTPGNPNFGGYCPTAVYKEAVQAELGTQCNTVDRLVLTYLGCPPKTAITTCRTNWCNSNYYMLDYTNIGGSSASTVVTKKKLCTAYVNDPSPSAVENFLSAVCATSSQIAQGNYPQDPTQCASNSQCQQCMNNLLDFPDEIPTILGPSTPSAAPTGSCPDLLPIGLNRKQLGVSQSGIEIDFQTPGTTTWTPIFALFDTEIAACNCETIIVNGTELANRVLVAPGNYRIKQCNGLNTDPTQPMCNSSPGYQTSVVYINPIDGAVFSQPYGQLVAAGQLSCTSKMFPGCPPDYNCCIWSDVLGWTNCMVAAYGPDFAKIYPFCAAPTRSPTT